MTDIITYSIVHFIILIGCPLLGMFLVSSLDSILIKIPLGDQIYFTLMGTFYSLGLYFINSSILFYESRIKLNIIYYILGGIISFNICFGQFTHIRENIELIQMISIFAFINGIFQSIALIKYFKFFYLLLLSYLISYLSIIVLARYNNLLLTLLGVYLCGVILGFNLVTISRHPNKVNV